MGNLISEKVRADFPILRQPIIYFDNACMSLKPQQVIDKIKEYYTAYSACAGRSGHRLALAVDDEMLHARRDVRNFISARDDAEIVFTRNTTEGLNLVANALGLAAGDEVIISDKEHNSNLIPWLKLKKQGINLKVCHSNSDNTFNLENFKNLFSEKTKLVSMVFTSNLDGVTNPIKDIAKITHDHDALLAVDGAQAVPGRDVNVKSLDVDFLSFSGHKMLGPTGTGVLYGKKHLLENMAQFIVGGETVIDSTYETYTPEKVPHKFEAGLQDYAGIIGLGEAVRYLKKIGMNTVTRHETELNKIVSEYLGSVDKLSLIGPAEPAMRSGIFSFNIAGMDKHQVAMMLEVSKSIMTRSGAHCVHSWFNAHNLGGSVRASMYLYNTTSEAQIFAEEVKKVARLGK